MTTPEGKVLNPPEADERMNFAPSSSGGAVLINSPSRAHLMEEIEQRLRDRNGFTVATLNLDHIVKLRQNPAFLSAYAAQTYVVADGNPIVWISRLAGNEVELVPGSEMVRPVSELAGRLGVPIGLFGSTSETLEATARALEVSCPGLRVVDRLSPPGGFDPAGSEADRYIDKMQESEARLWFLALGAPKQEIFAARASKKVPEAGFLSVGAGVDFIAGTQTRAPKWARALAVEWVWRMGMDPVRLIPRYAKCFAVLPGLMTNAVKHRRVG